MGVDLSKQSIWTARGDNINNNLIINSLPQSSSGWTGTGYDIVEKNGFKSIHFTGALKTTKYATPKYSTTNANNYKPSANEYFSMSCDVLFENVAMGTTNSYIDLYPSGATINGSWRGAERIADSGHFKSYSGWYGIDPEKINNIGWVHIYKICKYYDYTYPAISPNIYARDFTGDIYFKNIKFESSSTPTPWLPNPVDDIYISSTVPFVETDKGNQLYIGQDYIDANQFYEI